MQGHFLEFRIWDFCVEGFGVNVCVGAEGLWGSEGQV